MTHLELQKKTKSILQERVEGLEGLKKHMDNLIANGFDVDLNLLFTTIEQISNIKIKILEIK